MRVQNTLKNLLEDRGITRYRFWKDTKISKQTAYDLIDNPDRIPTGEVMARVCSAYQIQPGELLVLQTTEKTCTHAH